MWAGVPINTKELVPIVLAVAMWGNLWRIACSHSLRQSSCGNGPANKDLQRCSHDAFTYVLTFFLAKWDIALTSQHIPGATNNAAELCLVNNMQAFQSMMQDASLPTVIPQMFGTS